jgi:hypothetical protein
VMRNLLRFPSLHSGYRLDHPWQAKETAGTAPQGTRTHLPLTFHFPFIAAATAEDFVFPFPCTFAVPFPFPPTSLFTTSTVAAPPTPFLDSVTSNLLPTTTHQKSSSLLSLTGALSLNSFHHFRRGWRDLGDDTSYISIAAS